MADEIENSEGDAAAAPGGSLADAIAAHMALKQEHGADPQAIEHELEDALSPPLRDEPVTAEPEPTPEPAAEPEPASEPEPAPEPEPTHEPVATQAVLDAAEQPKPGEITGTIEFEFSDDEQPPAAQVSEHDMLEDVPDFFEETPEHDKLWFDEAPPRKFDF